MPSPFPGMDPYLEGHWWTSIHQELATEIAYQLVPLLRPKYVALPERKYETGSTQEVMISTRRLIPDVSIRKTGAGRLGEAGAAVATPSVKLRSKVRTRVPHFRVIIRDTEKRRLVTAIELLSPTNKGSGRKAYLRKRRRFLQSSAHLLEIDLHHEGRRVPLLDPYPEGVYFVLLSRARRRLITEIWSASIQQRLPTVTVPLLRGDPEVLLDLQAAFTSLYDRGGFDMVVDYRKTPDVDLSAAEMAWVMEHLRELGLR